MTETKPTSKALRTPSTHTLAAVEPPIPVLDRREFRNALGSFATGVTVITTTTADGRHVGLTCNSFASVSLTPPLVLWSLGTQSSNLTAFQQSERFTVNVLGCEQRDLAKKFARSGGDKFTDVMWTPGLGGVPVLSGCVAHFQCRCVDRYWGGDHVIFLGQVEAFAHVADAPLLFSHGKFGTFGPDEAG